MDEDITFADIKGTLDYAIEAFFGSGVKTLPLQRKATTIAATESYALQTCDMPIDRYATLFDPQ